MKCAGEINGKHLLPVLSSHHFERNDGIVSGTVDKNVYFFEALADRSCDRLACGSGCHICVDAFKTRVRPVDTLQDMERFPVHIDTEDSVLILKEALDQS